jgi:hypothetical protein
MSTDERLAFLQTVPREQNRRFIAEAIKNAEASRPPTDFEAWQARQVARARDLERVHANAPDLLRPSDQHMHANQRRWGRGWTRSRLRAANRRTGPDLGTDYVLTT